jgi:glycosyltransferase involved in cell wall biosynthesis
MNILMLAFSFEPCESSEPGVGWRFANIAARNHNVYVITNAIKGPVQRTKEFLARNPNPRIHVFPFQPLGFPSFLGYRLPNLHYLLWQRQVFSFAKKLHVTFQFDLVHHVTFSRYWMGSSAHRLPIPLIWGPVGSGGGTPQGLKQGMSLAEIIPNFTREFSASIFDFDPLLKKTLAKASICFAMNKDTEKKLQNHGVKKLKFLPQICFSEERLNELSSLPNPKPFPPVRLLSVGRLVYWKGFQLGIRVANELKNRGIDFQYRIVGWGPYEMELQKLINTLGLNDEVGLVGRRDNNQVIHEELPNCHVFIHPALHESFGNVCLEGLAAGKPVICLDTGGPASQVTTDCGFAVSVQSISQAVNEMANSVEFLTKHPKKYFEMSAEAKLRARNDFHINLLQNAVDSAYLELGKCQDD